MALTVIRKKSRALPGTTPDELSPLAALIDSYGKAAREAEPILAEITELQEEAAQKIAPFTNAKKKLDEAVAKYADDYEVDPDQPLTLYGKEFVAEVGKAAESRSISDLDAVKKHMGTKLFMELATVTLGNIDKYLTLPQREEVLTITHGKRKVNKVRLRS